MCRLYTDLTTEEALRALVGEFNHIVEPPQAWRIATTDTGRVIRPRPEGGFRLDLMRWGLVPRWAKDLSIGKNCVNARAETVRDKPVFRDAFRLRRCLVPASWWFEWGEAPDRSKQPYRFHRQDLAPLTFAGLWERWRPREPGAEPVDSYTVVTTEANRYIGQVHDRMPATLEPAQYAAWFAAPPEDALAMLQPFAGPLLGYPVARAIGSAKAATKLAIEPIGPAIGSAAAPAQATLFG